MIRFLLRLPKQILNNLYFLVFLNGILISSLWYFHMEANYEDQLFSGIQRSIDKKVDWNDTQDSIVIKIMQTCNNLLGYRASVFGDDKDLDGFQTSYIHPASVDLMTARGACGSYSLVLARILQNYQFPVRIAQMKANGIYGAHNIIEAKLHSGWVVLDPTFNLYFTKPDNTLASFADIRTNWNYYKEQVPRGYDLAYSYTDVRYTNWNKIPLLMPVIKKVLDLVLGLQKSNSICLRILFLKMYEIYTYAILAIFIPVCVLTVRKIIKTKIFPACDTPFTISNIIKYLMLRMENTDLHKSI